MNAVAPDSRFLECQSCEGSGEVCTGASAVYVHGCGFRHYDGIMEPCPECNGTGRAETPVSPVERDDDLSLSRRYELPTLTVLMFGTVPGCSWIAEQTLARGM